MSDYQSPAERAVGSGSSEATQANGWPQGVEIRVLAPDQIGLVEGLWRELLDHLDDLGSVVALVPHEQSWPRRRAAYEELLDDGRSFCLGAWRGKRLIGYAMVHIAGPDPVWATGSSFAELSTLSVTESERGAGVGTALLDAVEHELATRGIGEYVIGVDSVNDAARRFYERRGFRIGFHLMHGRIRTERSPGSAAARSPEVGAAGIGETDDETPETAMHGEP